MDKACVILGAGASRDIRGNSSPEINAYFKPPLAAELFDVSKNPAYLEIIQPYSGAFFLAQRLGIKAETLGNKFDMEDELRNFADHKDEQIQKKFRQIPVYLCDLLNAVSYSYTYMPTHYIELVSTLLADYPHDILFLVLNYDTFLEQAISEYQPNWRFQVIDDYVAENRSVKVVKLHGSVNWFKLIGTPNRSWDDLVDNRDDLLSKVTENQIHIPVNNRVVVKNLVIDGNYSYPVMTAPLAGKGVTAMVCPDSHIQSAKKFLLGCKKFLVIGTSGHDEDLLDLLDSSIDPNVDYFYHLIGLGRDVGLASENFAKGVRAFQRSSKGDFMFDKGFSRYILDGHLKYFATKSLSNDDSRSS